MTPILEIAAGDSLCRIAPALGGSLLGWQVAGQPMLRSASEHEFLAGDRLGLASFPLVPYSNRIGNAVFHLGGARISLTANFPPEPHAIHGTGWEDAWEVTARTENAATLELHHAGDCRWPWPFVARQEIAVGPGQLTLGLSATNLADEAVPLAFGHHPYFDSAGASLQFEAGSIWLNGADMLPTGREEVSGSFDFNSAAPLGERQIDHCYSGWDGRARIAWLDRALALEIASDLPAAVVYIPRGGDRFCFEPVPHSNDALNRSDAMPPAPTIAPGESFTAQIALRAVPR